MRRGAAAIMVPFSSLFFFFSFSFFLGELRLRAT